MDLSLNAAEVEHLAQLGVHHDAQGVLRSESGAELPAGTIVALLTKTAMTPEAFRRQPLRDGHAAASVNDWMTNIPGSAPGGRYARTGPAGPPGPAGSGTGDRSMGGPAGDLAGGSGDAIDPDLGGGGDAGLLKVASGPMAAAFGRHYLTAGHASDSPANTGHYGTTPVPHMDGAPGGAAHVAEPEHFGRGPLQAGHEADPPQNRPGGNNACPPGTDAAEVYRQAEVRWAANQAAAMAEHITPSTAAPAAPLPARAALPPDMRAGSVPTARQVEATMPAPGER